MIVNYKKKKSLSPRTVGLLLSALFVLMILFSSCQKEYAKYDNKEVIENSYTGTVEVTSSGADPAGDLLGDGDSGTYSFVWENSKTKASVNFDVTTAGGSVQVIVNDAKGDEVLNETLPRNGEDTFSGVTAEGEEGNWLITIVMNDFNGDGSYSIHPGS